MPYSQSAELSGVGASNYKSLGISEYSSQDMSRPGGTSFYSPQFGQQGKRAILTLLPSVLWRLPRLWNAVTLGQYQQYGFTHHYQPQHGQPPHPSQSSGSAQNPQYS